MAEQITTTRGGLLQDRVLNSLISGHFIVDLLNGQRTLLFAYLSLILGLSNSGLGVLTSFYVISSAVAQPIFGYIADRTGARWVAGGGVVCMGVFFTLAMFLSGWPAVGLLILASICSGAFHPAGASEATKAGRNRLQGREATASSIFFLFGQMGYGIGPMLGGPILGKLGMSGLVMLSVFTLPIGLIALKELKVLDVSRDKHPAPTATAATDKVSKKIVFSRALLLMIGISAFQSWTQSSISVYMPRFLASQSLTPTIYGVIIGLFTAGSAIGCLIGGELADRTSRKTVIAGSLLLSTIPLFFIALTGFSPWLYPLMFIAGLLTGGPFSVIVVQAQKVIPGGMGLASGLTLGFIFSAGAIGTIFTGMVADSAGFIAAFYLTTGIAMVGGILGLLLPKTESERI